MIVDELDENVYKEDENGVGYRVFCYKSDHHGQSDGNDPADIGDDIEYGPRNSQYDRVIDPQQ